MVVALATHADLEEVGGADQLRSGLWAGSYVYVVEKNLLIRVSYLQSLM